jgi:hypothetical protein
MLVLNSDNIAFAWKEAAREAWFNDIERPTFSCFSSCSAFEFKFIALEFHIVALAFAPEAFQVQLTILCYLVPFQLYFDAFRIQGKAVKRVKRAGLSQ